MIVSTLSSTIKQADDGFRLYYVIRDAGHYRFEREAFEELESAVLRWRVLLWQATGRMEGQPNILRAGYYGSR